MAMDFEESSFPAHIGVPEEAVGAPVPEEPLTMDHLLPPAAPSFWNKYEEYIMSRHGENQSSSFSHDRVGYDFSNPLSIFSNLLDL